jgi:hypothetical protein
MRALIDGDLAIEDLTYEELLRGKLMNKNGTFTGGVSQFIPRRFYTIMQRELVKRMTAQFHEQGQRAIEVMIEIMEEGEGASETIEDGRGGRITTKAGTKRLEAAKYIIERIIGKIPDKTEINANVTVWEGLAEGGDLIIDVEVEDVPENPPPKRKARPRTRPIPRSDLEE